MPAESEFARMDQKVTEFFATRFAGSPHFLAEVIELWKHYLALKLPNRHFVEELTSGSGERFSQRLWEMLLARHLDAQGHQLSAPVHGPDFRFKHLGRVIWVEAVSPEPRGLPLDWMEPPVPNGGKVGTVPHKEIVLRWTAAFKEKWNKLNRYRRKGIVCEDDAYVIAIHGGQLGVMPLDHGISSLPLAVETVFPVGPLRVPIDPKTGRPGKWETSPRFSVKNANGSPVPTTPFVDPTYESVSAILAYSKDRSSNPSLPAYVVHNPYARVTFPLAFSGETAKSGTPIQLGHRAWRWTFESMRLPLGSVPARANGKSELRRFDPARLIAPLPRLTQTSGTSQTPSSAPPSKRPRRPLQQLTARARKSHPARCPRWACLAANRLEACAASRDWARPTFPLRPLCAFGFGMRRM
jgi:type I restriction enzyme S subunit